MNNVSSVSFFSGLLSLFSLFALSVLIVLGAKIIYLHIKQYFPKEHASPVAPTIKKQTQTNRKRTPRTIKSVPVRTIEIDPNEVDRIYVKKSS